MNCSDQFTNDEIELIRKFRELDERGKQRVIWIANYEYQYTIAGIGEKLATCEFGWVKNAVVAGGGTKAD